MRFLIIGGTIFLGRALVDAAQARGHRVTLFNRGLSNPEAYPDIETIRGDRETDPRSAGRAALGRGNRHLRVSAAAADAVNRGFASGG